MHLILDTKRPGKQRKSPLQARFDKLNKQVARQRRLNERFRQDLDELAETYRHQFLEHNRAQLAVLIALAEKLCTFAGRKSLSDWHRDEIMDWLHELIVLRIAPLQPETAERLHMHYQTSVAGVFGLSRDEMLERVREQQEEAERLFNEQFDTARFQEQDAATHDTSQDDLFGFHDIPPDPEQAEEDDTFGEDWLTAEAGERLSDSTWIKNLFRRAAQALHPDREADPEQRRHKQQRMSELLRARRHNDIMTLLTIYSETVGEQDLRVAEGEMNAICGLLEQQLEDLRFEQIAYAESHPERQLVYDCFYHPSKKQREAALNLWKEDLAMEAEQNQRLIGSLRNLTRLKDVLGERHDQRLGFLDSVRDEPPIPW